MLRKLRKSSGRVTLVLIGVAALAGCGDDRRNVYASREDCLADWGAKPEDCTPSTDSRHSGRGFYYGPSHYSSGTGWNRSTGTFSSSRSIGSTGGSSRGGFGSSGRSSSSSSS